MSDAFTRIHTKKAIKERGEIFTPEPLVEEMLSKLPPEFYTSAAKTMLDPCCGNGNFLVKILQWRMEHGVSHLNALTSIYGIEIDKANADECRERLALGSKDGLIWAVLRRNIICGDSLDPKTIEALTPVDLSAMKQAMDTPPVTITPPAAPLSTFEEIQRLRHEASVLELAHRTELKQLIEELPAKHGYADLKTMLVDIGVIKTGVTRVRGDSKKRAGGKRLTDEQRKDIVALLKTGGLTSDEIATKFGVSTTTVSIIKGSAGLTKKRK